MKDSNLSVKSDVSLGACCRLSRRVIFISSVRDEVASRRSILPPSACGRRINQRRTLLPYFLKPSLVAFGGQIARRFFTRDRLFFVSFSSSSRLDFVRKHSDSVAPETRRLELIFDNSTRIYGEPCNNMLADVFCRDVNAGTIKTVKTTDSFLSEIL